MDEQLENTIERGGDHAAIHEKTAVSPADGEINEEADQEAKTKTLQQVNTESPTEEAVNAPDAGLSDALPQSAELTAPSEREPELPSPATAEGLVHGGEEGGEENTSPTTNVVPPPHEGRVLEGRDYYAEWQELAEAHPEVVGKELPEDIYQACMQSDLPPLRVYESMMLQKQADQISALQQEIATLRQNADNTARAPVVAAAEGPANEPEARFIKDFWSY